MHVRFGSEADIQPCLSNVHFTPKSEHGWARLQCPLCANRVIPRRKKAAPYRHGLRASELVALRWDDIDLATGRLHVRRAESGDASVHPISARESRALRKLLYVFISKRGMAAHFL